MNTGTRNGRLRIGVNEPLKVPFIFLFILICTTFVCAVLDMFSVWGLYESAGRGFTLAAAVQMLPRSLYDVLVPSVVLSIVLLGFRLARRRFSRFIALIIVLGVGYIVLVNGMLWLRPLSTITATTGLYDALKTGLGSAGVGHAFAFVLCLGALYCFFALLIPWTIGANRAAAESAIRGDLPMVFGRMNPRFGTPVGAAALTSIVGTVFTLAYGIIVAVTGATSGVETLFWNLFAFSSIVFMFCYLLLTAAFIKLRHKDPDTPRPYRVPGGMLGAWIVSVCCFGFVSAGILFFIWSNPTKPADWSFIGQMAIGLSVVGIMGVIFSHFATHSPDPATLVRPEHPEAGADV